MELVGTEAGFCAQTASVWQMIGYILLVFKIVIPVILIVIGVITLGKAVISTDDKEIKNGFNSMIKKFIVAVVIFFIPTIISALFGIVTGFNELKNDFNVCNMCITHPQGDYCIRKVEALDIESQV